MNDNNNNYQDDEKKNDDNNNNIAEQYNLQKNFVLSTDGKKKKQKEALNVVKAIAYLEPTSVIAVDYDKNNPKNDVINYFATIGGYMKWRNPYPNKIKIKTKSWSSSSYAPNVIFQDSEQSYCSEDDGGQYVEIIFRAGIRPKYIGFNQQKEFAQNFTISGWWNNTYTPIRKNNPSDGSVGVRNYNGLAWKIPAKNAKSFYTKFKLVQQNENSAGNNKLEISRFFIYGDIDYKSFFESLSKNELYAANEIKGEKNNAKSTIQSYLGNMRNKLTLNDEIAVKIGMYWYLGKVIDVKKDNEYHQHDSIKVKYKINQYSVKYVSYRRNDKQLQLVNPRKNPMEWGPIKESNLMNKIFD